MSKYLIKFAFKTSGIDNFIIILGINLKFDGSEDGFLHNAIRNDDAIKSSVRE